MTTEQQTPPDVRRVSEFLQTFCVVMLAGGAQTLRVERNARRIGMAYGMAVELAMFSRHIMLTVRAGGESCTAVRSLPAGGPNFTRVQALNALGWRMVNEHLPLEEAWQEMEHILALPSVPPVRLCLLVACANAAFCRLFEGDAVAMLLVFVATLIGFSVRQLLGRVGMNPKIVYLCAAFCASLTASCGVIWELGTTPQTALGVSVLFLIPGIPLINAVQDILDGHVLMGIVRAVQAGMLIAAIALGLSLTMLLVEGAGV
ncbi:threonine/serine exporter family protein [uncultured Desulfovibrio sp.]|uniref:threonine/serine exporter family protein n=1 Tax=uncultured Desulfovibrio sp. TaxID=167968 RepID=UPI0026110016|nr:threonine/serine exporter family protein [uncultured Desulfovibrio sp.]